jgi:hypothetical protein
MDKGDQIRILEKILDLQIIWINAADTKASPMLTLDTGMLAVLVALVPVPSRWTIPTAIFTVLATLPLLTSLLCLALAAIPRTKGPKQSIIFFGGIASFDESQYASVLSGLTVDGYIEDLVRQSHKTGEIAALKYSWITWAAKSHFLSILPWLAAIYTLYRMRS